MITTLDGDITGQAYQGCGRQSSISKKVMVTQNLIRLIAILINTMNY